MLRQGEKSRQPKVQKIMLDKATPPRTLKLNAADNVAVAVDPIDVGVSAAGLKMLIDGTTLAQTGSFRAYDGRAVAW